MATAKRDRYIHSGAMVTLLLSLLGLLVIVAPAANAVAMTQEYREILSEDGRHYAVAAYFRAKERAVIQLKRKGNKFIGSIDKQTALLTKLYELMIVGRVQEVADLYHVKDGSRARYLKHLEELPSRYDGYSNLLTVDIFDRVGWGAYEMVALYLTTNDGFKLRWREAIVCEKEGCFISNAIDSPEARKFGLFASIAMTNTESKMQATSLAQHFSQANKVTILPVGAENYTGIKQFPLIVAVDIATTKTANTNLKLGQKMQKAVLVDGYDLSALLTFFNAMKTLATKMDVSETRHTDKELHRKFENWIEEFFQEHVSKVKGNRDFFFASVMDRGNRYTKVEWYYPIAAIQRVSRWQSIDIVGFIPSGKDVAVFFQPTMQLEERVLTEPVQMMIMTKNSKQQWQVSLAARSSRYEVFLDGAVMEKIGARHGKNVDFVYEDKQ